MKKPIEVERINVELENCNCYTILKTSGMPVYDTAGDLITDQGFFERHPWTIMKNGHDTGNRTITIRDGLDIIEMMVEDDEGDNSIKMQGFEWVRVHNKEIKKSRAKLGSFIFHYILAAAILIAIWIML